MPQDEKKPVQVTITAAGNDADEAAVHQVVNALTATLRQAEIVDNVEATIVTKIKTGGA